MTGDRGIGCGWQGQEYWFWIAGSAALELGDWVGGAGSGFRLSVWVAESGVLFLCDRWQVQGYWIPGAGPGMLDLGARVRGARFRCTV